MTGYITIGGGGHGYATPQRLPLKYANRHGLIAGASGTGKTVTLQSMAEEFSRMGVPVFMADAKSDLSGIYQPGNPKGKMHNAFMRRCEQIGLRNFRYERFAVEFWDVFGDEGLPARVPIEGMGPSLFSKMLELTNAQEGIMSVAFAVAADEGFKLITLDDLQAVLLFVSDNASIITKKYGNVSVASVGAIQRKLLSLRHEGADKVFGMPSLDIMDLIQTDHRGYGVINILSAERLMRNPSMYGVFLLWMLTDLFKRLPEVGDMDKPKLVFFFDEAHMLFSNASKMLLRTVEQVVRLIRSKGVGVYFVSQSPTDIPDAVLGQLSNRVQHALRAYTARDQRAVRAAAETFIPNRAFSVVSAIQTMGVGEALVSFLDDKGSPTMVEKTLIRPPSSQVGPITDDQRREAIRTSEWFNKYRAPSKAIGARAQLKARAIVDHVQENDIPPIISQFRESYR